MNESIAESAVEYSSCPEESLDSENETFMTVAQKHRSEITKARGFYKKSSPGRMDKATQNEAIQKLKRKLLCGNCDQLGHRHKECPRPKRKCAYISMRVYYHRKVLVAFTS